MSDEESPREWVRVRQSGILTGCAGFTVTCLVIIACVMAYTHVFDVDAENKESFQASCAESENTTSKSVDFRYVTPEPVWALNPTFGYNLVGNEFDLIESGFSSTLIIFLRRYPRSMSPWLPRTWAAFNDLLGIPLDFEVIKITDISMVQSDYDPKYSSMPHRTSQSYTSTQNQTRSDLQAALRSGSCDTDRYDCTTYIRVTFSGRLDSLKLNEKFYSFTARTSTAQIGVLNEDYFSCLDTRLFTTCCLSCISDTSQDIACSGCLGVNYNLVNQDCINE